MKIKFFPLICLEIFIISFYFLSPEMSSAQEKKSGPVEVCRWTSEKVIILSAPAIMTLNQVENLNMNAVIAMVKYPGVVSANPQIEWIPHTLFLSTQALKKMKGATIIYDQSRELRKTLQQAQAKKLIEIKTRDQDPFMAVQKMIEVLRPLTQHCEESWEQLASLMAQAQSRAKSLKLSSHVHLFFLGEVYPDKKLPDLMINNDGPVLFLRAQKLAKLYPSELAYLSPSQKIIEKLKVEEKLLFIGLSSEEKMTFVPDIKEDEKGHLYLNIYRPEFLIPGLAQVLFLGELESLLQLPQGQ